ncbi:MAG: hypothetical protein F6K26_24010 [Moorea sp. SIO2I5]|nr:hypothetical protein [Moorena sp. SIO2I5]
MSTEKLATFCSDKKNTNKLSESQKKDLTNEVNRRIIQTQNHLRDLGIPPKFVKDYNPAGKKSLEKAITDLNLLENISF